MAKLSELQKDIVVKIWSYLPAKSVVSLKSVQKSWNDLVNDAVSNPYFVGNHFKSVMSSASLSTSFILQFNTADPENPFGKKDNKKLLTLHRHGGAQLSDVTDRLNGTGADQAQTRHWLVVSQYDSVVCLVDRFTGFVQLGNLATGEFKLLPDPCFYNAAGTWDRPLMAGFGYDEVSKVYKVVQIFGRYPNFEAKVCSTTSGDEGGSAPTWREVEIPVHLGNAHHRLDSRADVRCGGVFYWLVRVFEFEYGQRCQRILSFDLHREKFEIEALPAVGFKGVMKFSQWRESVALFFTPENKSLPIEVWVMSSASVQAPPQGRGLTKLMSISQIRSCRHMPIAFWNGGEEILMANGKGYLISFNTITAKYRRLCSGRMKDLSIKPYVDSFVSF